MAGEKGEGMLLGRQTPVVDKYSPDLLYPIPRAAGRALIGCGESPLFSGTDLWHAYEMSWLDSTGKPVVRVGRFSIPASSPNMVESKSFKLYLNSLNNTRFDSDEQVADIIRGDIAKVLGAGAALELLVVDDASLAGAVLSGRCLDDLVVETTGEEPAADMLQLRTGGATEESSTATCCAPSAL